jgi:aminoglycoside 3-N-acetyltransferase
MAVIFNPSMPVDRMMGRIPEALRQYPKAARSLHPILSFTGVNAGPILDSQTYVEPLAPIERLMEAGGWVLLLGIDHTVNTSIHYGERLAGRKQFLRWALTRHGVRECPGFPGCSEGFQQIEPHLGKIARQVQIGDALVQALPLAEMIPIVVDLIKSDPTALLCSRLNCPRCGAIRAGLAEKGYPE